MKENMEPVQRAGQGGEIEVDLVELLYFFYSKLKWIIAAAILGGVVTGAATFFLVTPKYTATSKVYMVSANSDSILDLSDLNLGTSLSKDYAEVLESRPIFEDVIRSEGLDYTYEDLQGMVEIAPVSDTRILEINAESHDPAEAKAVANALARLAVSRLPVLMGTMEPSIVEEAITPDEKSSPSYAMNTMLGALVFMGLVLAALAFRFISDDTLKTTEDVEAAFGVMPLAVVPEGEIGEPGEERKRKKPGLPARKQRAVKKGVDGLGQGEGRKHA